MANQDWPTGLQPVKLITGDAPVITHFPMKQAFQSTKYSTKIYKGQVVLMTADAKGQYIIANAASNTAEIMGVAAEYYGGSAVNGTKLTIGVWEGSEHIFAVQSDTTASDKWFTKLLYSFSLKATNVNTGDDNTGFSKSKLKWATGVTASTAGSQKMLKVIGYQGQIGDNQFNAAGANAHLLVRFNQGFLYNQNVSSPW